MKKITCVSIIIGILLFSCFASAQNIAQQAAAILEHNCATCHGEGGSFKAILDIEYMALMQSGVIVPGDPDASELYKRLLGPTDRGGQMPQGQDPLSPEHIEIIRQWIVSGAQDWTVTEVDRMFISQETILDTIRDHIDELPISDRPYARYFSMAHLYNAGVSSDILTEYQLALSKLVNSLSWGSTIFNPQPIDIEKTIFYIDLRYFEWESSDAWTHIEREYPYHLPFNGENQTNLQDKLAYLQLNMDCNVPHVYIDWFIANASLPPLYHDILDLPETDRELEGRLGVDVADNIINAPGRKVWRAGLNDSGVSNNNRVVERHASLYGAYWKSYDFASSVGKKDIYVFPTAFDHDGGEVVFSLPNGLQGYYLSDAQGNRLNVAPIEIVSNPAASDPSVKNGLSCIGCHDQGMKEFTDTVRQAIEQTPAPLYDKAHALRLYSEKSVMEALIAQDKQRYELALSQTGGTIGGIEPVQRFHEAYYKRIDVRYAAASLGLQTETFILKIQENTDLQTLGLHVLADEGVIKRDTWVSNFKSAVSTLFPSPQIEIPVDPIPEIRPDDIVHFPDQNLRAEIAKMLVKPVNDPITAQEMESFRTFPMDLGKATLLKNIKDLTGLEYAINLKTIWISGNTISDLSPIADLPNLEDLRVEGCNISDLSPIVDLTKLRVLMLRDNPISDLSPLASFKNLENISLGRNFFTTDISVLSQLTALKEVLIWDLPITNMSVLVNLPNIETINLCANRISEITTSEISALANAPKLKNLYIFENQLSDISILRNLTGLERLNLRGNEITDVSPLAALTNLNWLDLKDNPVTDWTPLYELAKNTKIEPNGFVFASNASSVGLNNTFTFNIVALSIQNLVGWQCNIVFDANILEAIEVTEGDFLSSDGTATFFKEGVIDNENGLITGFSVLRLGGSTISGSGTLLSIKFKAKQIGETSFDSGSCYLSNNDGEEIPSDTPRLTIKVVERAPATPDDDFAGPAEDINKDGEINIFDLVLVAKDLGKPLTEANPRSDVNGDGVINILDLTAVANKIGE